jgi:hypothetical protein
VKRFDEMTHDEKMQRIFSHAHMYCQAAIDNVMSFAQDDRETLESMSAWLEFNEQMARYLIERMESEFARESLGHYGVHVYSERARRNNSPR